jgi:hypothetical protein
VNYGQACARTNQQELTTCAKNGGHEKKKFQKNWAVSPCPSIDRRPQVDTWTGSAWFLLKKIYLFIYFWKFGEWAKAFGRMGAQYTHFFKLPPTLGSVKSSIPHRVWRLYFF